MLFRSVKVKLTAVAATPDTTLPTLSVLPLFNCSGTPYTGNCVADAKTPQSLGVGVTKEIQIKLNFDWAAGDDTSNMMAVEAVKLAISFPGETIATARTIVTLGSSLPDIRCDKKMAVNVGDGCVYAQSPAVLVMSVGDGEVREAAEHIRDAQASGSPGGLDFAGGVAFASPSNALQRTRVTVLQEANRNRACGATDSIIRLRPQSSASCLASDAVCDCDEYPFAATWNGAWSNSATTSARNVSRPNNRKGGTRLLQFYQAERILDFTPDSGAASIPARVGGDDFWLHVE